MLSQYSHDCSPSSHASLLPYICARSGTHFHVKLCTHVLKIHLTSYMYLDEPKWVHCNQGHAYSRGFPGSIPCLGIHVWTRFLAPWLDKSDVKCSSPGSYRSIRGCTASPAIHDMIFMSSMSNSRVLSIMPWFFSTKSRVLLPCKQSSNEAQFLAQVVMHDLSPPSPSAACLDGLVAFPQCSLP